MGFNEKDIKASIDFLMTDKCNYDCEYCSQEPRLKREKNHLGLHASDETINNFMDIIKNLEGQWEIKIMGGEALLHPRFFEFMEFIVSIDHNIQLTTNFSFPIETYKKLVDICGEKLVLLCASLHLSQVKNIDDFINKAIEFNNYKSEKTNFTVFTILTEENFEILKNLKENFSKSGINLNFQRLKINNKLVEYRQEIENYLQQHPKHVARKDERLKGKNMFGTMCYAGYKSLAIHPHGVINRCYTPQGYLDYLGNIEKGIFKRLDKPMPCLSKHCKCSYVILKANLIDLEHKNYLQAYYFSFLEVLQKISKQIKKVLHSIRLFLTKTKIS